MFKVELINGDDITVIHGLGIRVQSGSIKKETNSADSFELSMLPDNPGYNIVHPLTTQVRVTRTDNEQVMFDGRILQPKDNMESSGALTRSFTCEGSLAYLHDIVPGYGSKTGTWYEVIGWLLDTYNAQSESWKHIELGNVPDNGNVTVHIDTETDMYDSMYKFIVTDHSYEWTIRNDDNHRYLDVRNKLGDTKKEPVIRLAFNLQSMSVESDPTSVISRVIPLGKAQDGVNTVEGVTTPRIHLGMIGKKYYVDSQDLISLYGIQAKTKIWDDVTDPNQLEQLAINYLKAQTPVTTKYSVGALDLSTIGLTTDDFEIYNYYHVENPLMNIDDDLRVNGVTIDIINPQNASLTIGDKFKRQTDYAIEAINNGSNINQVKQSVNQLTKHVEEYKKTAEELAGNQTIAQQQIAALNATPSVKLSYKGLVITYAITEAKGVKEAIYTAEISADLNVWTAADPVKTLTNTITVEEIDTYYIRVKASIGECDSPYSQMARITIKEDTNNGGTTS